MKKFVSWILVLAILASGAISFASFAIPAYAQENEEVIETTPEIIVAAEATEAADVDVDVNIPEETEASEVTEATEAAHVDEVNEAAENAEEPEVDAVPEIPEELDGFEIIDFEIKDIEVPDGINILGAYQMVELCKEYDADAKTCIVRNDDATHYFVVEWHDGSVDTILMFLMDVDGEELLFSFGEECAVKF